MKGKSIQLQCSIDASPKETEISWLQNGRVIVSSGKLKISPDKLLLTIMDLVKDDDGTYECIARNSQGKGTSKVAYQMKVLCE